MRQQANALKQLMAAVRADYGSTQRYRAKYHGEKISLSRWPADCIRKIGVQMTTAIRLMQFCRDARVPLAPQIASRLIRHVYGAEIHWDARIAPGISIVHGNGLVVSSEASVEAGCILFQNVTLGQGIDATTREVGAPHLERDVHVGPGAVLLGPITVGEGSKIMAGVVLSRSVPAGSIVKAAEPLVAPRQVQSGRAQIADVA